MSRIPPPPCLLQDDSSQVFPSSVYCCVQLQPPLFYINQPKTLVTNEFHYVDISGSIRVNRVVEGGFGDRNQILGVEEQKT